MVGKKRRSRGGSDWQHSSASRHKDTPTQPSDRSKHTSNVRISPAARTHPRERPLSPRLGNATPSSAEFLLESDSQSDLDRFSPTQTSCDHAAPRHQAPYSFHNRASECLGHSIDTGPSLDFLRSDSSPRPYQSQNRRNHLQDGFASSRQHSISLFDSTLGPGFRPNPQNAPQPGSHPSTARGLAALRAKPAAEPAFQVFQIGRSSAQSVSAKDQRQNRISKANKKKRKQGEGIQRHAPLRSQSQEFEERQDLGPRHGPRPGLDDHYERQAAKLHCEPHDSHDYRQLHQLEDRFLHPPPGMSYHYDAPYGGRGGSMRGRSSGPPPPHYSHSSAGYQPHAQSGSPYSTGHGGWGSDPYANQHSSPDYGYSGSRSYHYPPSHSHTYESGPPPPAGYSNNYPTSNYSSSYDAAYDRRGSYESRGGEYERRPRGGFTHTAERRQPGSENYETRPNYDSNRGGSRRGRGAFANLSWTPKEGTRGGLNAGPKRGSDNGDFDDERSRHELEDDEPSSDRFRPPRDLRAEEIDDRSVREANKMPPPSSSDRKATAATTQKPIKEATGMSGKDKMNSIREKIQAQLVAKGQASGKPLVTSAPRKQAVKVMRYIKSLTEEHESSSSVYYRKPGNESVVGSGTYGKVYRAVHIYNQEQVALKKMKMESERDGFPITAMREIKIIQYLRHVNVVTLHEIMVEKNECYMVFEYLSHDLTGLLNHPTFRLTDGHKKNLAHQLMSGIEYMHQRGVLHRDLKAANILVSNTGVLKLADFGLARQYDKRRKLDYTNRVVTIWYRSPELLLGETQYGPAVDIWSAACVLVEIFTRHSLFPGDGSELNQLDKIYNVMGTPSKTEWPDMTELPWYELMRPNPRIASTFQAKYADKVSPEAFTLLQQMLSFDPKSRPTAEESLAHSYFTEEEPALEQLTELANIQGEWHEFESKKLRKEGEERRRQDEKDKRKRQEAAEEAEREAKKARIGSPPPPPPPGESPVSAPMSLGTGGS